MKYYSLAFMLFLAAFAHAQKFYVSYKPAVYKGPFTGNVILYLSSKNENPKNETGWPCTDVPSRTFHSTFPVFTSTALK